MPFLAKCFLLNFNIFWLKKYKDIHRESVHIAAIPLHHMGPSQSMYIAIYTIGLLVVCKLMCTYLGIRHAFNSSLASKSLWMKTHSDKCWRPVFLTDFADNVGLDYTGCIMQKVEIYSICVCMRRLYNKCSCTAKPWIQEKDRISVELSLRLIKRLITHFLSQFLFEANDKLV